jgi:hypothetical protein
LNRRTVWIEAAVMVLLTALQIASCVGHHLTYASRPGWESIRPTDHFTEYGAGAVECPEMTERVLVIHRVAPAADNCEEFVGSL